MLVSCRQLLFYIKLLTSDNAIIKSIFTGEVGRSGIIAVIHIAIRREYRIMDMDLAVSSRESIIKIFSSALKRVISQRNEN